GDAVEVAELALDRAEDVEAGQLRSGHGLLDRHLAADLAEWAAPALAVGWPVPRDVCDVLPAHEAPVRQPDAGRHDLGRWDRQASLLEPCGHSCVGRGHAATLPGLA